MMGECNNWENAGRQYDVFRVSRYVIYAARKDRQDITNVRLQKILYFLQIMFLDFTGKPCFDARIEAWDLGPTVPDVYRHYEKYESQYLPDESTGVEFTITEDDKHLIEYVVRKLSKYSTQQLINVTQSQDPWKKNYVRYNSNEIPLKDMVDYVKKTNGIR